MTERKRICAVMEHHQYLADSDPIYRTNRREIETFNSKARLAPRTTLIKIPVVVHVIYHTKKQNVSTDQIKSQIKALNRDFRFQNEDKGNIPSVFKGFAVDTLIEFELATQDPIGRPTTGITRTFSDIRKFPYDPNDKKATRKLDKLIKTSEHGKTAWPRDDYLNMWVCAISNSLLGYAQFPGGSAATDGVVINHTAFGTEGTARAPFNMGRTAVHEVGHWLNLLHIWGDDGGACSLSDNIHDTPNQAGPNVAKPNFPTLSCNNAPNGDMFMNYMDYVDDDSMIMFTKGQLTRMNAVLAGARKSLLKSEGLNSIPTTLVALDEKLLDLESAKSTPIQESGDPIGMIFDGVTWVKAE